MSSNMDHKYLHIFTPVLGNSTLISKFWPYANLLSAVEYTNTKSANIDFDKVLLPAYHNPGMYAIQLITSTHRLV